MSRTLLHVFLALLWAVLATSIALHYLESASATPDVLVWSWRVLSAFVSGTLGLALLLWSWLKGDAVAQGKPASIAATYALASMPSCGLAMVAYFFATRERKAAVLASLQFALIGLALLAAVIATVR